MQTLLSGIAAVALVVGLVEIAVGLCRAMR